MADAVRLVRDNSADTDDEIGQRPGLRHRLGARAEDRIRTARSTGVGNLSKQRRYMGFWGSLLVVKSDDQVSAQLPDVTESHESVFLDAEGGWRVWAIDREDTISEKELSMMVERSEAPALCAYVMDSDCAVIEALGVRTGFWRTCLGRESMTAYMAESGEVVEEWFPSADESVRAALDWAKEAGADPSESRLAAALAAVPDPFVEPIFVAMLEAMGVRSFSDG
ncbi:hypothetical protein ACPC3D_32440 [Streptomyces cellulosae]